MPQLLPLLILPVSVCSVIVRVLLLLSLLISLGSVVLTDASQLFCLRQLQQQRRI